MPELTGGAQGPFALIQPFMGESAQDKIRKYLDQQAAANAGAVAGRSQCAVQRRLRQAAGGRCGPSRAAADGRGRSRPQRANLDPDAGKLGLMLMDLQQQNEAQAGFNQRSAWGCRRFAQPRDREMVSKMFNPTVAPQDPFKMGESLMNMSSQQQGQDRANHIARLVNDPQGQSIADQLHMDWGNAQS